MINCVCDSLGVGFGVTREPWRIPQQGQPSGNPPKEDPEARLIRLKHSTQEGSSATLGTTDGRLHAWEIVIQCPTEALLQALRHCQAGKDPHRQKKAGKPRGELDSIC